MTRHLVPFHCNESADLQIGFKNRKHVLNYLYNGVSLQPLHSQPDH